MPGATASSVSSDEKSGYGKLYAGYQLMPWFALEGGLANLGKYSTTRTVTAPGSGELTARVETIGWHIDALLLMRTQSGFTPFVKAGMVAAGTRIEYSSSGMGLPPGTDPVHDQGETFVKLGIGVDFAFARSLSARLELEQMGAGRKGSRSPEQDVNVYSSIGALSLGLVYRF